MKCPDLMKKQFGRCVIPDLTGERFGRCVVIGRESLKGVRHTKWKIQCDCGTFKIVYGPHLVNGHTKSCGCLQREMISNRQKLRPYEFLFNLLKRNSQSTGIGGTLTYDEFVKFTSTEICHYCGDKIIWNPYRQRKKNYAAAYHLDRKDNCFGYTKDNCVVCCSLCNSTKTNQFSYDEMCEIGKVIGRIKKRRVLNGTDTPKS
jgi:hypothetical protein